MRSCHVLALPGGNPAPLVTVAWALHRDGWRADVVHAVLYARAQRWLHAELLDGAHPLAQLRQSVNDPTLAEVVEHLATSKDGTPLEDDATPEEGVRFMEAAWRAARALQESEVPIVFALVGGRKRTLTADLVVAFQLLARPQDRLVELRLSPSEAIDPTSCFYFPDQLSRAEVTRWNSIAPLDASEVQVRLLDVRVPRLRRLLPPSRLGTFADALAAGEDAIDAGAAPVPSFDLQERTLTVGARAVRLSADQAVWMGCLAVARRLRPDGWLDVTEEALPARVFDAARAAWHCEAHELSDAWIFGELASPDRLKWLGPLRSRLRGTLGKQLEGHPWRDQVVPEVRYRRAGPSAGAFERLAAPEIALCPRLEAVVRACTP